MPVIPADKRVGAENVRQILTVNAEPVIVRCAIGKHHGIVDFQQFGDRHVPADLDIAEIAHAVVAQRALIGFGNALDFLMIRGNAAANEAER